MKRIVSALLLLILLLLGSCGTEKAPPYTVSLESFTLTEETREIVIRYPVLMGEGLHESVNRQLFDKSLSFMELFRLYAGSGDNSYSYRIDSVIASCVRGDLISFLCSGFYTEEGASHPTPIVYALNIRPDSGELLGFEQIVTDFPALSEAFLAGRFVQESGASDLLSQTDYEEMLRSYSDLYGIYPPVYFLGDEKQLRLGIITELPYALGGWAAFSIPASDIAAALSDTVQTLIK